MTIKDSGKRQQLPGMVRDVTDDKIDYSLALDGPLFERLSIHLTEGAKKYSKRNWMGANSEEEYNRFRESFIRHSIQYLRGDVDEDHFSAIAFNLNGMEYVRQKLEPEKYTVKMIYGGEQPPQSTPERRIGVKDRRECVGVSATIERWRRGRLPGRRLGDIDC